MRSLFFTGKGGVGKSTISSAFGYQLSKKGYTVLIVSLDPAHNLGDIFSVDLGSKEKKITDNLFLLEVDLGKASKKYLKEHAKVFEEIYGYLKVLNMDKYFNVLKYTPGMEENASLIEIERIITNTHNYDFIIFDTPPTGMTLRIFALPSITLNWLEQLIAIRRQILDKRYTIQNIKSKKHETEKLAYKESDDRVMVKLYDMYKKYKQLDDTLKGERNAVSVVFNSDFLSMKESKRLIHSLDELTIPLRLTYNNKYHHSMREDADRIEAQLIAGRKNIRHQRVGITNRTNNPAYIIEDDLIQDYLKEI